MADETWRGNEIVWSAFDDQWVYEYDKMPVKFNPDRPCGRCGLPNTPEGHDGCLGTLPGVMNACCGHGVEKDAYVQFGDGRIVRGKLAIQEFEKFGTFTDCEKRDLKI